MGTSWEASLGTTELRHDFREMRQSRTVSRETPSARVQAFTCSALIGASAKRCCAPISQRTMHKDDV